METRLWRKNSLGIGTWRIWNDGTPILHYAHSTVEGGAEVAHRDVVGLNQSGRSLSAQIELEVNSRISRQLDKGYKKSREEAVLGSTNQLGLVNPMLAQPIERVQIRGVVQGFVQPKLDGHRCLTLCTEGIARSYSRKGKVVDTLNQLTAELSVLGGQDITLDGELYIHGERLQTISSIIKRAGHPRAGEIRYNVYDVVLPEVFSRRHEYLKDLFTENKFERLDLVETVSVTSLEEVYGHFRRYRSDGYEGAMFRRNLRGYEDAKRSDQLVKVKWDLGVGRADCEGVVVAIRPSKDGWAICRVRLDSGIEFDTSAPGSVPEKTEVYTNRQNFLGRKLTVEYSMLTADNVPFHAVAIRWHEEL